MKRKGTIGLSCMRFMNVGLVLCCSWGFIAGCSPIRSLDHAESRDPEEKVVRLLIWADYISPEAAARFEKETGIQLEISTFETQEEQIGRVWSAQEEYDVVVAEDAVLEQFRDLRLIQPLDPEKLPNLRNVMPRFHRGCVDPEYRYGVPYHWGTTLLAYRRDRIGDIPPTWNVLWDRRYKGRIWLLRDVNELVKIACIRERVGRESHDSNAWDRVRQSVLEQSRLVCRYADTLSVAEGLVSGGCDIGVVYSGDAVRAAERNTNIVYVIPEEGAPLWVDNFCLLRDAEHPDSAHRFINFMLDGAVAALNATPNTAALPDLNPALLNNLQIFLPAELMDRCVFYEKPTAAMLQLESMLRSELTHLPAWGDAGLPNLPPAEEKP